MVLHWGILNVELPGYNFMIWLHTDDIVTVQLLSGNGLGLNIGVKN